MKQKPSNYSKSEDNVYLLESKRKISGRGHEDSF